MIRPLAAKPAHAAATPKRFERLALSSILGEPMDRRTWSGAPYQIGLALQRLGIAVEGIHSGNSRNRRIFRALEYALRGYGLPRNGEALRRLPSMRQQAAEKLAEAARRRRIRHVLHFGTLDLPPARRDDGVTHYLYCDHDWALSLRHRTDLQSYSAKARAVFEAQEREAMHSVAHIFTFGRYVRDHIVEHYGVDPDRVTAIGSGMGGIERFDQPKDFSRAQLLFVAKHLFAAKGGLLLIEAFKRAREKLPELTLAVVGDERSQAQVPALPGIQFHAHLPWRELQRLYRLSTLLVQPMLNDPWGQVYLEAMVSRTPVIGLRRNGLPEILENGRHGFLVDEADPDQLASMILEALSDPQRLAAMALSGQQHVLRSYSWDKAAQAIAFA